MKAFVCFNKYLRHFAPDCFEHLKYSYIILSNLLAWVFDEEVKGRKVQTVNEFKFEFFICSEFFYFPLTIEYNLYNRFSIELSFLQVNSGREFIHRLSGKEWREAHSMRWREIKCLRVFFFFFNAISLRQSPQPQANVLWRETTVERATAAKEDWVWWCILLLLWGCNCGERRVKSREMLYVKVERWQKERAMEKLGMH